MSAGDHSKRIAQMYRDGMSCPEIAAPLGLTQGAVQHVLRREIPAEERRAIKKARRIAAPRECRTLTGQAAEDMLNSVLKS